MNLRPNSSFFGTPTAGLTSVLNLFSLPQPGTVGASYVVMASTFCSTGIGICGSALQFGNQTFPAGIYTRISTGTTMAAFGSVPASPGPFNPNVTPFKPGIIGTGVNLGINGPPANHGRQAWTNPPNIGVY